MIGKTTINGIKEAISTHKNLLTNIDIFKLFLIYFLNYFFIILNYQGIYWDDWSIYNTDKETLASTFRMAGGVILGNITFYMHSFLQSIGNGILIYRLLVFIAFFMSGIFIYHIINNIFLKDTSSAFFITALYLVLPINSTKIALINVPATLSLFLFFYAFYLLHKNLNKITPIRIYILFLFLISFNLNSLLVFYAIILSYLLFSIYASIDSNKNFHKILIAFKQFFTKYPDFIILPLAYFFIKNVYSPSYGLYSAYNKISFDYEQLTRIITESISSSIFEPIILSAKTSEQYWYITALIFVMLYALTKTRHIQNITPNRIIILFGLGSTLFILAVFPYAAVGKLPITVGWQSRHQVLIPLGMAIILYSIITTSSRLNRHIPKIIFLALISAFTIQNIQFGHTYLKDSYYQIALEENFKSSKIIKENSTFIVTLDFDNALSNTRGFVFFEYNGMLENAFGNDNKFMTSNKNNDREALYKLKQNKAYNFSSWNYSAPVYLIISNRTFLEAKDELYILKLLFYQFTDENKFRKMAKKLVTIYRDERV